ncbi:hypothetical protein D3C59_33590 [Streptomyces sp. SHP22-7]|nr:hypothetical protein D3C59_37055 [Streptomyces sp. SHP22-7]RIH58677.1 hypothetical protein D3C59_33590 [Streptomyces sp. SHP22-7]
MMLTPDENSISRRRVPSRGQPSLTRFTTAVLSAFHEVVHVYSGVPWSETSSSTWSPRLVVSYQYEW